MEKISIRVVEKPDSKNEEKMIKWFCEVFGLSGPNENQNIEEFILIRITEATYMNKGVSSSEIKYGGVARSTVIYHLNRFIDSGLVVKKGRKYYLRSADMARAIEEIEYDLDREMSKMLDFAREFDRMFKKSMQKRHR